MWNEETHVYGNVAIHDQVTMACTIHGSLTAEAGSLLVLLGTVKRDLIVKPGARVELRGTVCGSVMNKGGELRISGRVDKVIHRHAGLTIVEDGATVGNVW